ncbi:hypothetical protein DVH05_005393 [Phytophthora capsici]|nr:hypothetical protein DVH05_005393 [Phytophthora capsici]
MDIGKTAQKICLPLIGQLSFYSEAPQNTSILMVRGRVRKVSRRQRAPRSLRRGILAALISENIPRLFDDEDVFAPDIEDNLVVDFIKAYWTIARSRYLNKRDPVPRAPDMFGFWLYQLDESRFKEDFRVTRLQFTQVVELIESHPVFYNKYERVYLERKSSS